MKIGPVGSARQSITHPVSCRNLLRMPSDSSVYHTRTRNRLTSEGCDCLAADDANFTRSAAVHIFNSLDVIEFCPCTFISLPRRFRAHGHQQKIK